MKNPQTGVCLVLCTCPDQEVALTLSTQLVEARLAACVNVMGNVQSVFHWQDKVQSESEVLLIIKTTSSGYKMLEAWLQTHHPYEVPEILKVPVDAGFAPYLTWVKDETN